MGPKGQKGWTMSTVYKLVLEENGVLLSINAMGKYRTEYTPGERVDKKNLFVFTSLEEAERGCFSSLGERIWECETDSEPRHAPDYIPDFDHTGSGEYMGVGAEEAAQLIESFWSTGRGGRLRMIRPLRGSHLVDDVKLIREVSDGSEEVY
jgi:hypothetical protein